MFKNTAKILAHKSSTDDGNFVTSEYILHKKDYNIELFNRFCPHRFYPLADLGITTTDHVCKFHGLSWAQNGTPTNNNKNRIDFLNYNFQTLEENNEISMYYFLNHFDFDYYIAKFLMYLYEYKGFIESKGIKFLPFTFINGPVLNEYKEIWPYLKSEEYITGINGMNPTRMWEQVDVRFPKRITLIQKIEFWNIIWEYPNKVKTLNEEGYCNDGHFSPKGHDALAQNLIPQLKEKLEI